MARFCLSLASSYGDTLRRTPQWPLRPLSTLTDRLRSAMSLSGQIVEVWVPRRAVSFGSDSGRCSTRRLGAKRSVVVLVGLGSGCRGSIDDRCDEISVHHPLGAESLR